MDVEGFETLGERTALGSEAYQRLLEKFVTLDIRPGERVTVDALARELGVSQTPVREALAMLEADGLVVKAHLRGFFATPSMTRDELVSLYQFRLLIEPAAAFMAATHRTAEQLAEMGRLLDQMEDYVDADSEENAYSRFASLDAELHALIAKSTDSRHFFETVVRLRTHVHVFRVMQDATVAQDAMEEHRAIVQAIERADAHIAGAAMRSHVERSLTRVLHAFGEDSQTSQVGRFQSSDASIPMEG